MCRNSHKCWLKGHQRLLKGHLRHLKGHQRHLRPQLIQLYWVEPQSMELLWDL